MRIGLHGLAAVAPWQSLVAALGQGAEVAAFEGAGGARCDAIVVCAGLVNGDGEGAAVLAFARGGGPVLGLGAGFQVLCALGLLPGRVTAPAGEGAALSVGGHVRVEGRATPFTSAIPAGRVMSLGDASGVGLRYEIGEPEDLESRGQVIFRYCDAAGGPLSPTSDESSQARVKSGPLSRLRERVRERADLASHGARRPLSLTLSPGDGGEGIGRIREETDDGGKARAAEPRDRARSNGPSQLRLSSVPLIAPHVRARAIAGVCGEASNVVGVLTAAAAIDAIGAQLLGSLRMHLRGKR